MHILRFFEGELKSLFVFHTNHFGNCISFEDILIILSIQMKDLLDNNPIFKDKLEHLSIFIIN
jgi:hypothetical protein